MTCIVGIAKEGRVYLGGDSCGSSSSSWQHVPNPKVFHVQDRFLIGVCGSFRMVDLLRYGLRVQSQDGQDVDEFVRTEFVGSVRTLFRESGFLTKEDQREYGGNFLLGYRGHLFEFQNDFSVLNAPDWGLAIGSGEQPARGSLFTTRGDWDARRRIQLALEAAEATTPSVRGPFTLSET